MNYFPIRRRRTETGCETAPTGATPTALARPSSTPSRAPAPSPAAPAKAALSGTPAPTPPEPREGSRASRLRERLLDWLLPQTCAVCSDVAGRDAVCPRCQARLPRLPERHCPQCADISASGERCGHCLREAPHFDRVIAPFAYAPPLDTLVQGLKYGHRLHLARWFGEAVATAIAPALAKEIAPGAPPLIVPMPLHPERLAARGFNQALEIARPLARRWPSGLAVDLARRTRMTPAQVHLAREERQRNLRGAFDCGADLAGRMVIVVDDVMTSGSTANELARILKLHGAGRVWIAVAARTLDH